MDIMLPGKKPLVAPSALVQARQRLGAEAVKQVFLAIQSKVTKTARLKLGQV